jgi:uncharacterized protein YdeI (YjbR/CyaY-like superfamily)
MNDSKTAKPGAVHKAPTDLRMALSLEAKTLAAWKDLTPLARNEWICWVTSAKQQTTRSHRIQRAIENFSPANAAFVVGLVVRIADPARRSGFDLTGE